MMDGERAQLARASAGALRRAGWAGGWLVQAAASVVLLATIAWLTVPRVAGWEPQVVLSGSMEPALPVGSVAFLDPRDAAQVRVGDILTFRHPDYPGRLVSHRVVSIETGERGELSIRTKGDANDSADPWVVSADQVVGVVVFHLPYAGYAHRFVRTPAGFGLLIGVPAALVAVGELGNIARQVRRLRRAPQS